MPLQADRTFHLPAYAAALTCIITFGIRKAPAKAAPARPICAAV